MQETSLKLCMLSVDSEFVQDALGAKDFNPQTPLLIQSFCVRKGIMTKRYVSIQK